MLKECKSNLYSIRLCLPIMEFIGHIKKQFILILLEKEWEEDKKEPSHIL